MAKMKNLLMLSNYCCTLLLHLSVHTLTAKAAANNTNDSSVQATTFQHFRLNNSTHSIAQNYSPTNNFGHANAAGIYKIVLGLESSVLRSVPAQAQLQLTCRFFRPTWYRAGKLLENSSKIITLKSVQPQDAGVYSCYTPTGLHGMQWSNLTLKVTAANAASQPSEDDIADLSKIEDAAEAALHQQQLAELVEAQIVTTVEPVVVANESVHSAESFGVRLEDDSSKLEANDALGAPKFKSRSNLRKYVPRATHGTVYLNCAALGNPLPTITWLLNDTTLNIAERKYKLRKWSLSVEDLSLQDAGFYKCVLCNKFGCIEHSTKVSVLERASTPEPVLAVRLLRNVTVPLHGQAQLECLMASDFEAPTIWLKHRQTDAKSIEQLQKSLAEALLVDSDLSHYENVFKLPTNEDEPLVLRLGNVQLADEGWYTCMASDQAMASAYLKVLQREQEPQVPPLNAANGSKIDNYDKLAAKPKLAKLPPKLRATELELDNQLKHNLTNDNDINAELNDTDNDNKDADISGEEESAPKFKKSDKLVNSIHKPAGSSVQIICPAIGNPAPNITWTRNSTEITRHIGKVTYKKWSIQMEDIITEDSGVYKCTLCNKYGCIEHTTKLTINDRLRSRPILSDKFPQNQTVLTNRSAVLECRVVSDLEPYILWIKYTRNNETIRDLEKTAPIVSQDAEKSERYARDFVKLPTDPDKPHVLRLENITHGDEGWYTCIAANALGQSMASAYLKVVDKLPSREVYNLLRSHPLWMTVVAIVVVSLFLLGSLFIIYVLRKLKHEKLLKHRIETVHQWTKKVIIYKPASCEGGSSDLQVPVIKIEKQRTTFQTSANVDPTQGFNEYEFPLDSNWEIPRSQLALGSTLGEGAFGRVVMAEACGLPRTVTNSASNSTIVAVKMVKEEHTDADMASLVREMEVMKMIGKHINIINLLGCCTQSGPLWVIVEFAPHGNLKDFLKQNRPLFVGSPSLQRNSSYLEEKRDPPLTEKNLISFAFQIARGMEYLASRRCIHRDLAARNVLVSDDYVMKIADFGLARDIQDTDYYRKNTNGRLPIKWMAPESLQEKFYDSQSDVWSYGVLLWEIMTYGEQPYPNIMSAEELYSYLITGQRMEKPPRCSLNIYMLMRQCWHFDASARPTFSEIVENLEKILQLASTLANEDYLDLSMPMLETPPSSSDEESEPETFQETSPLRYQYTYKFN